MCGRYAARSSVEEVAAWFGAAATTGAPEVAEPATAPRTAGPAQLEASARPAAAIHLAAAQLAAAMAPTDTVRIVVADDAGRRCLLPAQWGLVPAWASDRSIASSTFNARAETAALRPAFRKAMQRRRCLLPADAFFEWTGPKGNRRPWLIRPIHDRFLAFGGLFEDWRTPEGSMLRSCTILTTAAAADIAALHDRAPLIVDRQQWSRWLDPRTSAAQVRDLLTPAPAGSLVAEPLAPAARQQPQPTLF